MSISMNPLRLYKCLPIPPGDRHDTIERQAIQMVIIHNVVIRGYNSIIYHSNQIKPENPTFGAFLDYCAQVNRGIRRHHDAEEAIVFPLLQSKLGELETSMNANLAGHAAFESHLSAFSQLVAILKSSPTSFDAEIFQRAVHTMMEPLYKHLTAEIDTIRPEQLRAAGVTEEALLDMEKRMTAYTLAELSVTKDPQSMIVNGDSVHGAWFPPIPAVPRLLIKYGLWWVHSDMWAFGSCDGHMVVKPEFAAYEPEMEE